MLGMLAILTVGIIGLSSVGWLLYNVIAFFGAISERQKEKVNEESKLKEYEKY